MTLAIKPHYAHQCAASVREHHRATAVRDLAHFCLRRHQLSTDNSVVYIQMRLAATVLV